MRPDPMEVESQIAELILGMPGRSTADKIDAILARWPDATANQMLDASEIAAEILEAAAAEYEAKAAAIHQEIKRRGGSHAD